MLSNLRIENFRCFRDHRVEFRPTSIVVGRNNAGKSTLVEALRLVSTVEERFKRLHLRPPPEWLDVPQRMKGVAPAIDNLGIDFQTMFHRYGDPPAIITAQFSGGEQLKVYLGAAGAIHAVAIDLAGQVVSTAGQCRGVTFAPLRILPQVAPLLPEETTLVPEYVRRHFYSTLAYRHFRNQLRLFPAETRAFRALAEESWPGLRVRALEGARGEHGDELHLFVQDGDFVAEVARMGHGLQMWLQVIWFLARTPNESVVILDEPDVYMHADLQRKLIRMVKNRYAQVIVATHSVEIMAEVKPRDILVIDHKRRTSAFADSTPGVQAIVDRIGSIHNLNLARLATARRCLLVEGEDLSMLRVFQSLISDSSEVPLDDIPNADIGGWGGWSYAIGSAMFIHNALGETIRTYCILDRDYHTPGQVESRYKDAAEKNVSLHVWQQKELENYILVPEAIQRVIACRVRGTSPPTVECVRKTLDGICESLRDAATDGFATSFQEAERKTALATANRQARELVARLTEGAGHLRGVCSGKEVLSRLSGWAMTEFNVSFGPMAVCYEIRKNEVASEIAAVLRAINRGNDISTIVKQRFPTTP